METHETPLERMLRDAWHEPGLRPAFYKRLLDSEVLVPVEAQSEQLRTGKIEAGGLVHVITLVREDQVGVIPLFTSSDRVFEASPGGERCAVAIVRELFKSRPDMHFHLNPYSRYGREFSPGDVQWLLSTGGIAVTQRVEIPYSETPALRPATSTPAALLPALCVLYARNFDIRAAYVAECLTSGLHDVKQLVVIDLIEGGDYDRAIRETGTVITEIVGFGRSHFGVAVLPRDDSAAARFFEEIAPFYTIGLAGSIASALRRPV